MRNLIDDAFNYAVGTLNGRGPWTTFPAATSHRVIAAGDLEAQTDGVPGNDLGATPGWNPDAPWTATIRFTAPTAVTNISQMTISAFDNIEVSDHYYEVVFDFYFAGAVAADHVQVFLINGDTFLLACTWGAAHLLEVRWDGANFSVLLDGVSAWTVAMPPFGLWTNPTFNIYSTNASTGKIKFNRVTLTVPGASDNALLALGAL